MTFSAIFDGIEQENFQPRIHAQWAKDYYYVVSLFAYYCTVVRKCIHWVHNN